jgi:polar amino acid transport system permease protein
MTVRPGGGDMPSAESPDAPGEGATAAVTPRIVPTRHVGQWISGAVVLLIIASIVAAVAGNHNFDFGAVPHYFVAPAILDGLRRTIVLTVIAMGIGIVIGIVMAVWRLSTNPVLSGVSWGYIWFFRGTPVLVQLVFWFNLGVIFHTLKIGIPFTDITLWQRPTTAVITSFSAALLGLGLNEGAYMAEIVRGGIISVDPGQSDAALALGLRSGQTMRYITLPQALRVIIPPTGNEVIGMLKLTALASVISYTELLGTAENIYSTNLKTLELLVVASLWYLICTSVLSVGQYYLERRVASGSGIAAKDTPLQRVGRQLVSLRMRLPS